MHNMFVQNNSPQYKRNTLLIGLFYLFSSANCFLTYFYFKQDDQTYLSLGILLLVVTPFVVRDRRKENKNFFAVLCSACIHLFFSAICLFSVRLTTVISVYLIEVALCILSTCILKRVGLK